MPVADPCFQKTARAPNMNMGLHVTNVRMTPQSQTKTASANAKNKSTSPAHVENAIWLATMETNSYKLFADQAFFEPVTRVKQQPMCDTALRCNLYGLHFVKRFAICICTDRTFV